MSRRLLSTSRLAIWAVVLAPLLVLARPVWAADPEPVATLAADSGGYVGSAQFSSDGKTIFTTGSKPRLRLWDAKNGKAVRSIDPPGGGFVTGLSADGTVAVGFVENTVTVWDLATGKQQAELKGLAMSARLSPDGTQVVTGSEDKTVRVWDAKTGKLIRELTGHQGPVASVGFNADGTRVATGSYFGEVKVWDAKTGKEQLDLKGMSTSNNPTVFSADGKFILSPRFDTPAVWSAKDGDEVQVFKGHKGWCRAAAFSPSGDRIATAGADKTARVWDVKTGTELFAFKHGSEVRSAVFSPDGKQVLTVSEGKAHVWLLPAEK